MAILRVCVVCQRLSDQSRCPEHRKDHRPSASQRGYNHEWRAIRANYLSSHLICEYEAGCINRATDVHHLDGSGPLGDNRFSNLQALCHSHHSQETSRYQPGGWNDRSN